LKNIGFKLQPDWKNIYRRLHQHDQVSIKDFERIAFKYGIFLASEELKIIANKFG
jgi:hypothetical protein